MLRLAECEDSVVLVRLPIRHGPVLVGLRVQRFLVAMDDIDVTKNCSYLNIILPILLVLNLSDV